jgi:hypothetical protein
MMMPEPSKGGRPPRHGVRLLARQLGSPSTLPRPVKRALARLQRELDAKPVETVRDTMVIDVSVGTLLYQRALHELMASPDLRKEGGLAKFAYWIGNHLGRQRDQLLQLEHQRAAKAVPSLEEYLASKAQTGTAATPPAPPASAAPSTVSEIPAAPPTAADAVQDSDTANPPTQPAEQKETI